jgi:protein SCO1
LKKFRPDITKNIILILVIITFLFLINYYQEKLMNKSDSESIKIGGSFILTDKNETLFNSKIIEKYKIIYFGYTFCPDVCPFDVLKLSNFFSNNKELIKYIQPIFITLDPERDNSETLRNFLDNFNPQIIGLTGTETMITNTLNKFRVYKKISSGNKVSMDYLIDHTALFYILDKKDNYITHLSSKNFNEEFNQFVRKNFY